MHGHFEKGARGEEKNLTLCHLLVKSNNNNFISMHAFMFM